LFKLISNEMIKIVNKISTWIMLILIIVSCVCFSGLLLISYKQNKGYMEERNFIEGYKSEISYLEEIKTKGYEVEIEKLQFLIDNNIDYEDWKYELVNEAYEYKLMASTLSKEDLSNISINKDININSVEESFDKLKEYIKNNQWKEYYKYKIKEISSLGYDAEILENAIWEMKYRIDKNIEPNNGTWQDDVVSKIGDLKTNALEETIGNVTTMDMNLMSIGSIDVNSAQNKIKILQYRLENNIEFDISETPTIENMHVIEKLNFWVLFLANGNLIGIVGMLIIVIAGGIVATEFSEGTIKFLLINPIKRWKILFSKYMTVLIIYFIMLFTIYFCSMIIALIIGGTEHISSTYLYLKGDEVYEISGFLHVAKVYVLKSVSIIVMATLAFSISCVLRNSNISTGISIVAMFLGNFLNTIFRSSRIDWGRFLIFANTDLDAVINGKTGYYEHSLKFALIIISIHMVTFLLTAWDGFTKKEV